MEFRCQSVPRLRCLCVCLPRVILGVLWSVPGVVRGVHPQPDASWAFSRRLVVASFQVSLGYRELANFAAGAHRAFAPHLSFFLISRSACPRAFPMGAQAPGQSQAPPSLWDSDRLGRHVLYVCIA